jgi:hypothetical protein
VKHRCEHKTEKCYAQYTGEHCSEGLPHLRSGTNGLTRGKTPEQRRMTVIRIGRNRVCAARTAAFLAEALSSCACSANSTIKIAFFAASPTRSTNPIWVRTLMSAAQQRSGNCGQQAHEYDQDHRQRQFPARRIARRAPETRTNTQQIEVGGLKVGGSASVVRRSAAFTMRSR